MKNLSSCSLGTLILTGGLLTCVPASAGARVVRTIDVGTRPESVTRGFDDHHYVTVMGEPGPGDATVKVIRGNEISVFARGMDEPKGIAYVGGFLVATDLKRVWKIDANGQKSVLADESAFPEPVSYLNDTAASPDGRSVFVTDMGANTKMFGPDGLWPLGGDEAATLPNIGRVYQITLDGQVRLVVDAHPLMACPNGVSAPAPGELLVAEFFRGNLLSWQNGRLRLLHSGYRGADTIERGRDGSLYVSSWTQGTV